MSSKGDKSAMALISVAQGAIRRLISEKMFSQVNMNEDLIALDKTLGTTQLNWCPNLIHKDQMFILIAIHNWDADLRKLGFEDGIKTTVLVKIATRAVGDLLDKLSNPIRKRNVYAIFNKLEKIDMLVDANNTAFLSGQDADKILNSLYKQVGFTLGD